MITSSELNRNGKGNASEREKYVYLLHRSHPANACDFSFSVRLTPNATATDSFIVMFPQSHKLFVAQAKSIHTPPNARFQSAKYSIYVDETGGERRNYGPRTLANELMSNGREKNYYNIISDIFIWWAQCRIFTSWFTRAFTRITHARRDRIIRLMMIIANVSPVNAYSGIDGGINGARSAITSQFSFSLAYYASFGSGNKFPHTHCWVSSIQQLVKSNFDARLAFVALLPIENKENGSPWSQML